MMDRAPAQMDRLTAQAWLTLPFAGLLLILPFPGTVAMRLLLLSAAFVVAVLTWRRLAPPPIPCKLALLLWVAVSFASLTYAADPAYSLQEIKNEIGYAMMAFVAFFAFTRDTARLRVMVIAGIAAAAIVSAWALMDLMRLGYWDDGRGHGGVGAFASLAVAVVPLLGLSWALFTARWQRLIVVVVVALLALASFHSHQRILWATFGVQLVLGLLLLRSAGVLRMRWPTLLAVLVAVPLVAGILLVTTHEGRVNAGDKMESALDRDYRLAHWGRVTARIAQHPFSGAGFGREGMKRAYPDLVPDTAPQSLLWHPHNVFLTYGIGMGWPGIAALVFLFASLASAYWRQRSGADAIRDATVVAGLVLLAGVITRNFTNDFFVRDGALLFWALTGTLLGFVSRRSSAAAPA